jgi:hypothetical protein
MREVNAFSESLHNKFNLILVEDVGKVFQFIYLLIGLRGG